MPAPRRWGIIGELNVGQLMRQKFAGNALLVGFTTYTGTVTAASEWDGPAHRKAGAAGAARQLRTALPRSRHPAFLLNLHGDRDLASALEGPRLERAIGVLYLPETERQSHYFRARLAEQFDYLLHFDETRASEPLERTPLWESGELGRDVSIRPVEAYMEQLGRSSFPIGGLRVEGDLVVPEKAPASCCLRTEAAAADTARGIGMLHGCSRTSGFATFLLDLLTPGEEADR